MTFEWSEFMKVATILARGAAATIGEEPTDEACQRTSVSRAYYAAFHESWEFLKAKGKESEISTGPGAHTAVPRVLKESGEREWKKIGNKLDNLKSDRHKADYEAHIENVKSLCAKSITNAKELLQLLESLRQN